MTTNLDNKSQAYIDGYNSYINDGYAHGDYALGTQGYEDYFAGFSDAIRSGMKPKAHKITTIRDLLSELKDKIDQMEIERTSWIKGYKHNPQLNEVYIAMKLADRYMPGLLDREVKEESEVK